jgi:quinol-cytochrome oxidoreductase complex cytochrome b subunit
VSRRSLGRGRLIIVLGALATLAGSLPAWWTVGGQVTETLSGNAFDPGGVGIVVFLGAIALLFVVVLPYATREGVAAIDRPLTYGTVWLAATAAFAFRVYQISQFGGLALPDRAPGLWITAAGLAVIAWGVVDVLSERPPETY